MVMFPFKLILLMLSTYNFLKIGLTLETIPNDMEKETENESLGDITEPLKNDNEGSLLSSHLLQVSSRSDFDTFLKDICQAVPHHTMCLKEENSKCNGMLEFKEKAFQEEDKLLMVQLHNEKRRIIANGQDQNGKDSGQPKAANMRKVTWDDGLARVAQKWANQCYNGHEHEAIYRMAPGFENAPYVGQNIKQQYSTKSKTPIPIKKAVENWFKEKNYFKSEWLSPFQFQSNPVIGHYTQLAWANTYKIGCGASWFKDGTASKKSGNFFYKTIVVCNYGPNGNTEKAAMYLEGEPCSQCPDGFNTCEDSLCS